MKATTGIFIIITILIGCAGLSEIKSGKQPIGRSQTAYLVSFDKLEDDGQLHRAMMAELVNSGFKVIDLKDKMPDSVDGMIFNYKASWGWDFVMVISTLEVNILDGKTKEPLASGHWDRAFFHNYPTPAVAARELFREMHLKKII
jgi:hypothetical protein